MASDVGIKTPMMKQYFDIKAENPGALVMFRLGDFYEFFGEDAAIASRELDIVLTGRDAGMEERMPMCGVPHHALDQYLARLIQKGYRVCICEQLEDPKSVKGLVKRGVVRVVTPGTAMEAGRDDESVYIASLLHGEEDRWAFSMCEVSVGRLRVAEFTGPDCLAELSGEIARHKPKEILISENDYLILTEYITIWAGDDKESGTVTLLPGSAFDRNKGRDRLEGRFSGDEARIWLDHPLAGDCAGAILGYLEETQKTAPAQIRTLELDTSSDRLIIDPTTFRNLEVTRNLRTYEKKGSLLDLMDKTRTAFGARLLRNWLEEPLVERAAIEARLDAVESLHQDWSRRQGLRRSLNDLYDMERLMTRVVYQRAVPRELVALKLSFGVLPALRQIVGELAGAGDRRSELYRIHQEIDELKDLYERLDAALTEDIPNNWKDGGYIKPGYDPQADEYRESAENGRTWMLELEQKEREKTGIKSLKVGFNKVFGYYFDVTKSNLSSVPEYFQRKQTLASGERFVTEELIRLEGMVLGAEEKMVSLEFALYQELLACLAEALPRVQITAGALARLDVFQALGELAAAGRYCRPRFQPADQSAILIKDLRHPVVEQIMENNRFVPNDLAMEAGTSLYIITGPNMGGKSTYCRSVAIAFLMAQTGSFIPASSALIPIRDKLFARVGASDDLRGGQSTFMMEMNEVAHILRHATDRSLVILDEVGRGTGTYDGMSVAWSVSQYLSNQIKAKTLFATHYLELTNLAGLFPEVKNLSLAVEEEGERIIFLHKIIPGSANKSYGVHVARLAGLPDEVILGAGAKLAELERGGGERPAYPRDNPGQWEDEDPRRPHCPVPPTENAPQNSLQLSIFAEPEAQETKNAGKTTKDFAADAISDKESKALRELAKKNLSTMTPIDALNYLYKLQTALNKEGM